MVRLLGVVSFALMSVGCAEQVTTTIAVGPSAASRYALIREAVDAVNDEIGEDVFELITVSSDRPSHDWAPVVLVDEMADGVGAECERTRDGMRIRFTARTKLVQLAHEFGHAAGLDHVDDYDNLMFRGATDLELNGSQRNHLLGM